MEFSSPLYISYQIRSLFLATAFLLLACGYRLLLLLRPSTHCCSDPPVLPSPTQRANQSQPAPLWPLHLSEPHWLLPVRNKIRNERLALFIRLEVTTNQPAVLTLDVVWRQTLHVFPEYLIYLYQFGLNNPGAEGFI